MSDLTLETVLTANAAPLNAALASGAQSVQQFGKKAEEAARTQGQAARDSSTATAAMASAMRQASSDSAASVATHQAARKAVADHTVSAGQLGNAYRMLPMQINDFIVQVANGGSVLTAASQQGAQVADSFGGWGNAMKAVTSLFTPLRLAMMAGGVVAAVLTAAYRQGAAESDAYTRAMILSGNAAGTTRTEMSGLAREISGVVGTQNQAADALAQLAATGAVSAQNLQLAATTTVKMQREMGAAVKDTVADFAALGKDPVSASVKLNQQYNYLTTAVYDQIKALEKRGLVDQAGELAQRTYAQAMNQRTEELKANLGSIETAWRAVTDTAAKAWDAILGVGRKTDPGKELEAARKALAALEDPNRKSQDPARDEQRKAAVRQRIADLTQEIYLAGESAAADKSKADAVKNHIATEDARAKAAQASADAYKKLREEVAQRLAQAQAEITNGGELTATQRFMLDIQQKLADAGATLGPVQRAQITAYAQTATAAMRAAEAQRQVSDAGTAALEASRAAGLAAFKEAESVEKANQALRDEIEVMGLTGQALAYVEMRRIASAIAIKEEELARYEGLNTYSLEEMALRDQIELLKEKQRLVGVKATVQQDQAVTAAFEKERVASEEADRRRSEGLADSIGLGILEGSRKGFDIMEVMRRELVAQFNKTVLRPMIQPFVEQGNKLVAGLIDLGMGYLGLGGGSMFTGGPDGGVTPGGLRAGAGINGGAATGSNLIERDMLTLLHKGEAVVPKEYNPAAGGTAPGNAVNVTIVNQTGTQATAKASRKSDGGIEVLLTAVEEHMAGNVAAGTGPMSSALQGRYGLRPSFGT